MPVTAKLSRRFYETFGDDIANELVEWFNQVDSTYRSDLRELNELNFARFDAKLEQRVAELDAKFERRISELEAKVVQLIADLEARVEQRLGTFEKKVGARIGAFEAKVTKQIAALDQRVVGLDQRISGLRAELIKWMFVFWIGTLAPLAGLIILLTR